MVYDDDVRLSRNASRLEDEALVEVPALEALTEIRFRSDLVPCLGTRRRRQVAQRSVAAPRRPAGELLDLLAQSVIEQRGFGRLGVLESSQTDVVAPALEQGK